MIFCTAEVSIGEFGIVGFEARGFTVVCPAGMTVQELAALFAVLDVTMARSAEVTEGKLMSTKQFLAELRG